MAIPLFARAFAGRRWDHRLAQMAAEGDGA